MEDLQLRKTMGGYKREDVVLYIESLVKKYEDLLEEEKEETRAARAEAEAAMQENAVLSQKLRALEAERDSVSRAVISAQREADKILADAEEKGAALVQEKEQEAIRTEERIAALRSEIHTLRLSATAALRRYEKSLTELVPEGAEEE